MITSSAACSRPYQVVVWGATGFTGKLVCEHILKDYQGQIRWAMAGRSTSKLETVKQELSSINPDVKDVPTLVADISDQSKLDTLLGQTDVIISTVGPYDQYGTPIVESAVRMKTHYCDLTGEVWWVKKVMDRFHYEAASAGVNIVHCCGYDSIPFDIGTLFLVDYINNTLKKQAASVVATVMLGPGEVSGGTVASLFGIMQQPAATQSDIQQPYYLINPPDERGGPDGPDDAAVHYDNTLGCWTSPHIMAPVNTRVVRRSWALLGRRYGENFGYREMMRARSWLGAAMISCTMVLSRVFTKSKFMMGVLKMILPKPGEGPSRESMLSGCYHIVMKGTTQEEAGQKPTTVLAEFKGIGDAGYYVTARWLLECALCMALQMDSLRSSSSVVHGGVLTPASALGQVLIQRLAAAGTQISIKQVDAPE